MSGQGVVELFHFACSNVHAHGLTFDEFEVAVLKPSPLEEWIARLSLPKILAVCMSDHGSNEELVKCSELTDGEISSIAKNFAGYVDKVLHNAIRLLKVSAVTYSDSDDNRNIRAFEGGTVNDFHAPLTDRIGWPNMDFVNSIEKEHHAGQCFRFKGREISPNQEYLFVTCPHDHPLPSNESSKRSIPNIELLLEGNTAKEGNLGRVEVIALVLYSGPMKTEYNNQLRKIAQPSDDAISERDKTYSTTIFVLGSAIVKLTKLQRISTGMRLFRGVNGLRFPDRFQQPDNSGRKGITEYAFMSTTGSFDIALQYSGVADDGARASTIFEIEVGSVDRGASIKEFSQYEHENEYLWAPGTFLEPREAWKETFHGRTVTIQRVRAKSNLKVMTIEEMQSANKDMHLASFDFLIRDLKQSLEKWNDVVEERLGSDMSLRHDSEGNPVDEAICSADSLIQTILDQCRAVRGLQSESPAENFSVDRSLLAYTRDMLHAITMAKCKLRGYIEDESRRICFDLGKPLRNCHREWTSFLRRRNPRGNRDDERRLCVELELIGDLAEDANDLGEPWLVAAAADGRPERDLRVLLSAGEDVNMQGKDEATAVFSAAEFGYEDSLRLLLEANGDMELGNCRRETPLWVAAQKGQAACVSVLINARADVSTADKEGMSPVWVAAQRGHDKILDLLSEAGADLNAPDSSGDVPALAAAYAGHGECIHALIRLGADVGRANKHGVTPLMIAAAAASGSAECVEALVAARVDVNAATPRGRSAAHFAAEEGNADCLLLLHAAGADLRARCEDGSPEEMAASKGHAGCVELMQGLVGLSRDSQSDTPSAT